MTTRAINLLSGIMSAVLLITFAWYETIGPIAGVTFVFLPILTIVVTYTILAHHQFWIAHGERNRFLRVPVTFRWVLFASYASFAALLWFIILDYFWPLPFDPHLGRIMWLQSALVFLWFLRRFLVWEMHDEPDEPP